MQVVVPVQQVYAPGAIPGEALCDRQPVARGVFCRNGYHPGVDADLVPELVRPGLVLVCVRCVRFESDWNVAS